MPQEKQKITVAAIYATVVLIICLMAVLLVSHFVDSSDTPPPSTEPVPMTYVSHSVTEKDLHSGSLILVNKSNKYYFEHNPSVVSIPTSEYYGLRDSKLKANPVALDALKKMLEALNSNVADSNVVILTAYRSEQEQTAANTGTPAGYSDFHTGMSFELKDGENYTGVNATEKYKWLYENAHKYGFIIRYPDDTDQKSFSSITGVTDYAYVFRYVGIPHASYIYKNDICLEEYLELLRTSHGIGNKLSVKAGDSKNYDIYYCEAASEIQVPESFSYDISGDNMNGYIVTVSKTKSK